MTAISFSLINTSMADQSGEFSGIASGEHNYASFPVKNGAAFGGLLSGTVTITASTGGPFVEGSSSLMECVVLGVRTPDDVDLEAICSVSSSDEDAFFMESTRTEGSVESAGSGGDGSWIFTGGTGKYAGLSGRCDYSVKYLPKNKLVTDSTCMWTQSTE